MDETGHTNSQTSIAVAGSRILIGFNDASPNAAGYAFSTDAGASFSHRRLPAQAVAPLGDAFVAFGPSGEAYLATLIENSWGASSVGVARSVDGGATFGPLVDAAEKIVDALDLQDQPRIAVDTAASSPRKGYIYLTWTYLLQGLYPTILFCRSRDGGATFESHWQMSRLDGVSVGSPVLSVAPNGDVYLAYEDAHISPAAITFLRSTDGGATWSSPKTVATFTPLSILTGGSSVAADSYPAMAVDGKGVLHIAWAAPSSSTRIDRSDIFYSRSTDRGTSFSTPRKVNDDATATTQAFPAIAATSDGYVGITWSDRRNDPVHDGYNDRYMTISPDGGVTFGNNFRVTDQSSTYGPSERQLSRGYHGAFDGIAADSDTFYLSWSDERGTDPDVYFTKVPKTASATSAGFGLVPEEPQVTIRAGESVSLGLSTFSEGDFRGPLTLSASIPVEGLSSSYEKATVNAGGSTRLTLSSSAFATPGDHVLTLSASADGMKRSATLRLTVLPASRTLGSPANLTRTPGFTSGMGVIRDPARRLHLLFEDDSLAVSGMDIFYLRSTDEGLSFSSARKLNEAGSAGLESALAADGAGRVLAVWAGRRSGDTSTRVFVARSTDGGATFSAPVPVSPAGHEARFPAVALDGAGNALIAYFQVGSNPSTLETMRSTDGGASFAAPSRVPDIDAAQISRPALVFDSKGTAFLGYTAQIGTVLSSARVAVAQKGQAFQSIVVVSEPSRANAFGTEVAVGPDDNVAVAYYARLVSPDLESNREIFFTRSTDSGKTYSTPVNVSGNPGQSSFPAIAVEPSGAISIAWEDTSGNNQADVFLSRSTDAGRTFSPPLNVSATPGLSGSVANPLAVVPVGGSGRTLVVPGAGESLLVSFTDDSRGNPDVFLSSIGIRQLTNRPPSAQIVSPEDGFTVEAGIPVTFRGTVTDPDGDPLTLQWTFGDGTSASVLEPPAHTFAVPGIHVITLIAKDAPGAAAASRITIQVKEPTAAGTSLLLPVVLDAPGEAQSHYISEVTLASRSLDTVNVLLAYTSSLGKGSGFARLAIAPGQMRTIPGIISFLRDQGLPIPGDGTPQAGTLRVTFDGVKDSSTVFAGVRTYTHSASGGPGTFGLWYGGAAAASSTLSLFGLEETEAVRSNIGLVNAGEDPITLEVRLLGPGGEDLETVHREELGPYGWAQLLRPLRGKAESGRAVITRISGTSSFSAYGVLNDTVTSDGSFLPPLVPGITGSANRLIPVILDAQGVTHRYRTSLTLCNLTANPLSLLLDYRAAEGYGSGSGTVSLNLAPGEQRIIPDAIAFLREQLPIESDGRNVGGSLLIRTPAATPPDGFAAGARTFAAAGPDGTFGLFYPGLTLAESADGPVVVYGLEESASQRSNVALVNWGDQGDAITLELAYRDASGSPLTPSVRRTLLPGEWYQFDRPLAALGAAAGYVKVERVSGRSRFVAYGVRNDNTTSDGSYILMSR